MSTASRVISGSMAQWGEIGINLISQIILVPVFLTYWNIETYGIWLAIQALLGFLTVIDLGHQEFLGYEFLRLGVDNKSELVKYLWAGIAVNIVIGITQVIIIFIFIYTAILPFVLGQSDLSNPALIHSAGIVLLLLTISWIISTSTSSLFYKALAPFGYYPRMAWRNFFISLISNLTLLVAVISGADFVETSIITTSVLILSSIPVYYDLNRLLRKEGLVFSSLSFSLGLKNFGRSTAISARSVLEYIKHQGVRLIIMPITGAVNLTAFSTMRTGANVALQGLNTIVNPMMPELMRFLHKKDQDRINAAFATVWFVAVAILAPGVVLLQAIVEPLFHIWTKGKIAFNPILFASFSLTILVYASIQPAIAIVKGNNMLAVQLRTSTLAGSIVIAGVCILVPYFGIVGAGISLLCAEVAGALSYKVAAHKWLTQNKLLWPQKTFLIVFISICISAFGMIAIIALPQFKWVIVLFFFLLLFFNLLRYWKTVPALVTQQMKVMMIKVPFVKKFNL